MQQHTFEMQPLVGPTDLPEARVLVPEAWHYPCQPGVLEDAHLALMSAGGADAGFDDDDAAAAAADACGFAGGAGAAVVSQEPAFENGAYTLELPNVGLDDGACEVYDAPLVEHNAAGEVAAAEQAPWLSCLE